MKEVLGNDDEVSIDVFNSISGIRPVRASGTCWISHTVNAMNRAITNFGLYLKDVESLSLPKSEANGMPT